MADTAVVTLGPEGAVAMVDGRLVAVDGTAGTAVVDTTGAGDLFAAALAWADLLGADADVGLAWANLYAGLSVGSHTGIGGAVTRDRLVEEGSGAVCRRFRPDADRRQRGSDRRRVGAEDRPGAPAGAARRRRRRPARSAASTRAR